MPTGYEDIDNLNNQASQLYDEQMNLQRNIINTQTQQTIDEIQRNRDKAEQEALKTNRALYTDYQKQVNPYGVNAENLYEQGLANSGLAETTKAHYYNTYQTARTEAQNNANQIKADFDNEITRARQNGDLQLAQSALQMYQQKINDLYNTYNLKYQRDRDVVSDDQWKKQYEQSLQNQQWQQAFNQAQFDYQKERDKVADNQWQQQFNLSKKASSSSRSSSRSSGSSLNLNNNSNVNDNYVAVSAQLTAYNTLRNNIPFKQGKTDSKQAQRDIVANALRAEKISPEEAGQLIDKFKLD